MGTSRILSISSTILAVLALALPMPMAGAFFPPQSTPIHASPTTPKITNIIRQQSSSHLVLSLEGRIRFSESNEASRQYRRTVYTFKDWPVHRSPERFRDGVKTFFASRILRGLFRQVAFVGWVATFTVVWNGVTGGFVDLAGVPRAPLLKGLPMLVLPMEVFSLTSSSLGLLLGACFIMVIFHFFGDLLI